MNQRTRFILSQALLLCLMFALGIALIVTYKEPLSARKHEQQRIEEDDPGWNCETMGNRVCGP